MNSPVHKTVKKILRISLMHRIRVERETIDHGLYFGQLPVLEYVMQNDGCTQAQLAQHMQVSPPSVARSVARMERAGLIMRVGDTQDRRRNQLSITPKATDIVSRCRGHLETLDRMLFDGFSNEEITVFSQHLDRIIQNLSTDNLADNSMHSLVAQAKQLHGKSKGKNNNSNGPCNE